MSAVFSGTPEKDSVTERSHPDFAVPVTASHRFPSASSNTRRAGPDRGECDCGPTGPHPCAYGVEVEAEV